MNWRKPNFGILLVSVLLLCFLFPNSEFTQLASHSSESIQNGDVLTIVTSLDSTITNEFEEHFLATSQSIELGITEIDFRQVSTLNGWKKLLQDPSKSVDLAWGFASDFFYSLEEWNLLKPITNLTLFDYINSCIPSVIYGTGVKHFNNSDLLWFGTSLQTYGFTINHDFLDYFGLPVPTTWEELASPVYHIDSIFDAISMGDPPLTTSNTRIYQIILQAFGWEEGWSVLTRIGANARIYPGSVDTRAAVVHGDVGIGLTTSDFGFIAKRENPDTEFIIPEGQSIVDFCHISLGKNCDDQEAAEAFLQYVVSAKGQSIWLTEGIDLFPLNIDAFDTPLGQTRPDMRLLFNETLVNNCGIGFDYSYAYETYEETVYYFHDTIAMRHSLLQKTWGMMVQMLKNGTLNSTYFIDLVYKLGALPENLECYEDSYFPEFPCPRWYSFAQDKYQSIIDELLSFNSPTSEISSTISLLSLILIIFYSAVTGRRNWRRNSFDI